MNNPLSFEIQDPNNTAPLQAFGGGPFAGKDAPDFGKSKITSTDMSGESGQALHTIQSMADRMPTQSDDSGLGGVQSIDPITFGDPNNSAVDAKDGYSMQAFGDKTF